MKVPVIDAFIDKDSAAGYNAGDVYESADKDRIEELRAGGFLDCGKTAKEKPPAKKDDAPATPAPKAS